jgi:hypothetical protein
MRALPLRSLVCAFTLSLFLTPHLAAQTPLEPQQLPSSTAFYFIWRGTPTGDVRKVNSLLALWDDPDFASVRSAVFENMTTGAPGSALASGSAKNESKPALTRVEAEEYSSLLENAFVIGYLSKHPSKMTASAAPPKPADHPYQGLFFVYNRTGKEALLSKAVLHMRGQEKELPQLSQITIAGVPALKVERKTGTSYWVEHGKYAAGANELSVLEEILGRLEGKSLDTSSLVQSAAYKEAQPQLGGGLLEFFAVIPNLKELPADATTNGVKLAPILGALKLEAIHSLGGRVVLEGAKTHFQAAILGDTASGSLFDLWSTSQQSPASLSLLPPTAVSYSEGRFDLPAFYEILKRAVAVSMPPGQQNGTAMIEALAQSRLGMPIADALALPSGEFASMQLSPSLDPQKSLYLLGIRKKPETLKLIRTIFSDQITSERTEGDTTFLKISLHGSQGSKGVAQWNFYHVAVTPDFLIAGSRSETLRDLLATRTPASALSPAAFPPKLQAARANYPEKLNGLNYFDYQQVDWAAVKARSIEETKKIAEAPTATAQQKAAAAKLPSILDSANPQVFSRHLHFMAGASWKDAKGIHFDQWLE